MNTEIDNGNLCITINILIVEDNQDKAFALRRIIEGHQSCYNSKKSIHGNKLSILYSCCINGFKDMLYNDFNGNKAYVLSMEYVTQNVKNIDIILCDNNLHENDNDGNVFLSKISLLEKEFGVRIYKILHSIYPDFQNYQRMPFVDAIYNANQISKEDNMVIKGYEERVLKYVLYGNPGFYPLFYKPIIENEFAVNEQLGRKSSNVLMEKILYVYSSYGRSNYQFKYLNDTYSIAEPLRSSIPISDFDNEWFFKVADSLYINKLWFAQKDFEDDKIKFITRGDEICILNIAKEFSSKKQKNLFLYYLKNLVKPKKKHELLTPCPETFFHF